MIPSHAFPPFDPSARCPKCGYDNIGTSYRRNAHDCVAPSRTQSRSHGLTETTEPTCCDFEHHERTCRRCGFAWAELVL